MEAISEIISVEVVLGAIIGAIMGTIMGGLITWIVARFYYKKASKDLISESAELRELNRLMLLGMEHAGLIKLTKDNKNNILGFEQIIGTDFISNNTKVFDPSVTNAGHDS